MARIPIIRPGKDLLASSPVAKSVGGEHNVARLFVPGYADDLAITIPAGRSRNSDARRRLARLFEQRRIRS